MHERGFSSLLPTVRPCVPFSEAGWHPYPYHPFKQIVEALCGQFVGANRMECFPAGRSSRQMGWTQWSKTVQDKDRWSHCAHLPPYTAPQCGSGAFS